MYLPRNLISRWIGKRLRSTTIFLLVYTISKCWLKTDVYHGCSCSGITSYLDVARPCFFLDSVKAWAYNSVQLAAGLNFDLVIEFDALACY